MSNPMKAKLMLIVGAAVSLSTGTGTTAQSWLDFAHPSEPHNLGLGPIKVDGLYGGDAQLDLPVLVILLEFPDPGGGGLHRPEHSTEYWEDLVFGNPRAGYDDPGTPGTRPSMTQIVTRSSNGRVRLIPAAAGDCHGAADGMVGWIAASQNRIDVTNGRREAIERADLFFDYYRYDTKPPTGIITPDELGILVVFSASDPTYLSDGTHHCCCCTHDPPHPNCPDCKGFSGRCVGIGDVVVDNEDPAVWCPGGSGSAVTIRFPCVAAATTECADANLALHELLHEMFGLDDLYAIDLGLCNPGLAVVDGYICYNTEQTCGGKACNDTFADAKCVEDGEVVNYAGGLIAVGNTTDNTGTDQSLCGLNDTIDVWYTYTPAYSDAVTVSLCIPGCEEKTAKFDTTLSIFDGSGIQLPGACNDDFAGCPGEGDCDRLSELTVNLTSGVTYYIRVSGYNGAAGPFRMYVKGGGGMCHYPIDHFWFPQAVNVYSDMGNVPNQYFPDLSPWVKLHLGWIKPVVVTHDGTYTLYDAETLRSFTQQTNQPEALIVYDPLRSDAYQEYFLLENRNIETLPDVAPAIVVDRGMAVWLINEYQPDGRRIERLLRRGGHRAADTEALWDGSEPDYYALSESSSPQNTNWSDRTASYIAISDVSAAGQAMTLKIRMPPIFVDKQNTSGTETGGQQTPFNTVGEAVAAIPIAPRTIAIKAGSYPEARTITTACTLMGWGAGSAIIGQ